jgi:hypothetical protein
LYNKKIKLILVSLILLIQTLVVVGPSATTVPLQLAVATTIPSIPSDGMPHPALYVSIVDAQKNPHPLSKSLNITISSSDTRLLIQESAVIKATEYYVILNASSTITEKQSVEVTVSAPGFTSAKTTVTAGPPAGTPQSLEVTILPDKLLPLAVGESDVIVTIVDSYGNPTKARTDLRIALSSSDLKIADVQPKTLVISSGEYSAKAKVVTTGQFQGSSSITASITDLKPDSATITVQGPTAYKLYLGTPIKQTIDSSHVLVGIVDSNNKPVKLVSPATVSLYSSDISILKIQSDVTIGVGEWCAVVPLVCSTYGVAKIFASAENLLSTNIQITVTEEKTSQIVEQRYLKLTSLAPSFPADESLYTSMIVQVVDSQGNPVKMTWDQRVDVFSASAATLDTASYVTIQIGRSLAAITAVPKLSGDVKVTAIATNMIASEITMSSYSPSPDSLIIQAPPIPAGGVVEGCLILTKGGVPAPVLADSQVLFTFNPTDVAAGTESVYVAKKSHFAYITINGNAPGKVDVTSSGSGLPTTKTTLTVLETKPSTFSFLPVAKPIVNYNFPMILQLISTTGGSTVTYEPITINLASSNITNIIVPETVTVPAESSEVLVYAKSFGNKATTLTISSPGFKSTTVTITPYSVPISITITGVSPYPEKKSLDVKATVVIDNSPIEGIPIIWKGAGLQSNNTLTDSNGSASNILQVKLGSNTVEAGILVGENAYYSTKKTITGVIDIYTLQVTSNAPITISGSGNYRYGENIYLEAPAQTSMGGILGLLNGKMNFKEWTGFASSTERTLSIKMTGASANIMLNAVYTEDYFMLIVTVLVPLIIIGIAYYIYTTRIRKTITIKTR